MIRNQKPYMTLESLLIQMDELLLEFVQPFDDIDIFNITGYNIDDEQLFKMFVTRYKDRLIGEAVPFIGKKYINGLFPSSAAKIENRTDQLRYLFNWMYNQVTAFLSANLDNYDRMIKALTADYNPLENYNMLEMSGSVSKVSDTKSTPGKVTTEVGVFPYNSNTTGLSNSKPESISETSANQSTAGFLDANQDMQWASGDDFGVTPKGNSVAMNKHTRSGNIGVTTSQQMLEQELKVRLDSVVDEFLARAADTCLLAMWK